MDLPGLATFIADHRRHDLVRVETLGWYVSASDGTELDRFLAGEPEPDRRSKAAWLERIRTDTRAGRAWRRIRIVEHPPTAYVRYSCEWGYTDNSAAGEQVRMLDLADAQAGAGALVDLGDFYLIDDAHVVAMRYDPSGAFAGAEPIGDPFADVYRSAARAGWAAAEPFDRWWPRHPEYHRSAVLP